MSPCHSSKTIFALPSLSHPSSKSCAIGSMSVWQIVQLSLFIGALNAPIALASTGRVPRARISTFCIRSHQYLARFRLRLVGVVGQRVPNILLFSGPPPSGMSGGFWNTKSSKSYSSSKKSSTVSRSAVSEKYTRAEQGFMVIEEHAMFVYGMSRRKCSQIVCTTS